MNLITKKKEDRLKLIDAINAEYNLLLSVPNAMKTAIYGELAIRHGLSTVTIRKYVSKKIAKKVSKKIA